VCVCVCVYVCMYECMCMCVYECSQSQERKATLLSIWLCEPPLMGLLGGALEAEGAGAVFELCLFWRCSLTELIGRTLCCSVLGAVCSVLCCSVCALCCVLCALCSVLYAAVCFVLCALCSVLGARCSVLCALYPLPHVTAWAVWEDLSLVWSSCAGYLDRAQEEQCTQNSVFSINWH
jgi:hypothetical protein